MRAKWLLMLCFINLMSLMSCRKNTSSFGNIPQIPGSDTTPELPGNPPNSSVIYNQLPVHIRIGKNVGGYYEALPPAYDSTSLRYPLLLFIHGGGELGDGSPSELPRLLKNSLTKRLHSKNFPVSFTVDGQHYSFIIISPQFSKWPKDEDIEGVMHYVKTQYRVDSSRIYVSGLSMGGGATWEYAGSAYGKKLAAIVPICGASWADSATARQIAKNEVPAWAFHNEDDDAVHVNSTKRYARLINAENPPVPVRVTLWPISGHDAWTKASDPDYREEDKNMYEWMLQYSR